MRFSFSIISLFILFSLKAQEETVQSVYFEFDKFLIAEDQKELLESFMQKIDSSRIESVEIFGYCDDRGKDAYNYKLSTNRANEVKDFLVSVGVTSKIIITIEGKGRILIDDDIVENLPEVRSKNRRVDVLINLKPFPKQKLDIPGVYTDIKGNHVIGDRIYLENLLFDRGSSKLTYKAKRELDRIARLMMKYKTLHFEIQGHVCCTPTYQKEAIDKDTRKRELSKNRAEAVYKYLVFKKIAKDRMQFKGYGNTRPLGKSPDLDRRVELVITKT